MKLSERIDKLRKFVKMAGKATPVEQLVLDCAERVAQLEAELDGLRNKYAGDGQGYWQDRLDCVEIKLQHAQEELDDYKAGTEGMREAIRKLRTERDALVLINLNKET